MRSRPLPFSAAAGRARSPVRSPGAEPACRRNAAPGPGLGAGGGGGSAGAVPNGCDPGRATRGLFENSTVGVGGLGSPAAVRRDRYTWQPGSPAARPPRPHKDGGQRPDRERRLLTVSRGPEPQAFYNLEPKELKEARKYHAPLVLPYRPSLRCKRKHIRASASWTFVCLSRSNEGDASTRHCMTKIPTPKSQVVNSEEEVLLLPAPWSIKD